MGYSYSIGNRWATIPQNTWALDTLGSNGSFVSPSIMSPNDVMGANNDLDLLKMSFGVDSLVNTSAQLQSTLPPMMNNFMAQMAAKWQQAIQRLSANNTSVNWNFGIPDVNTNNSSTVRNKKLSEDKIISMLVKMGSGDAVSDRINQEITIKDKDGNEVKTTILRRLISLCDEYRKDPKGAELTKENYEKIWEIADKYAKDGTISSEDFATLKEIALNPAGGKKDDDDAKGEKETPLSDIAEIKKNNEAYKSAVKNTAENFKEALYHCGTDHVLLSDAKNGVNADNIVEVYDEFNRKHGIDEGETLIEAIYNDFDDWTNTWYGLKGSASTFTVLHDAVAERANNHISKYGDEKGTLKAALDKFNTEFEAINDDNYDSKKTVIKQMFADIIKAIKTAEAEKIKAEEDKTK